MTAKCKGNSFLKILLTGNPNVGKSVVFSRFTGAKVISANFPGTTVTVTRGETVFAKRKLELIDVPGAYSLHSANKAEEVATKIIEKDSCDIIFHVMDATSLERNLFFALEIIRLKKPVILLLNKWDLAKLKGIDIDTRKLSEALGVEVISFVAITGEGADKVVLQTEKIICKSYDNKTEIPLDDNEKWKFIGALTRKVQTITHKHPGFLEKLAEISISPGTGFFMAAAVLVLSFFAVRFIGEGLINFLLYPLYDKLYLPAVEVLVKLLDTKILSDILLGSSLRHISGMGVLSEGVKIALVIVLPYIFAFYLILGFLEDLGYLPRLAVLLDNFLHKLGLHGYASVPMILGLGCKVPAILSARILQGRRERIIVFAMLMLITPCMPQSALIFSVLSKHGLHYVFYVFAALFVTSVLAGVVLNKFLKGETTELFLEIPPWHIPSLKTVARKVKYKLKSYLAEAVPMILLGVLLINIGQMLGLLDIVAKSFYYPVTVLLGLPEESIYAVVLGFLRKDVSIAMLLPFGLTAGQLVIGSVFLSMYLPCVAAFFMIIREAGIKDALLVVSFNLFVTIIVCSLLNILKIVF